MLITLCKSTLDNNDYLIPKMYQEEHETTTFVGNVIHSERHVKNLTMELNRLACDNMFAENVLIQKAIEIFLMDISVEFSSCEDGYTQEYKYVFPTNIDGKYETKLFIINVTKIHDKDYRVEHTFGTMNQEVNINEPTETHEELIEGEQPVKQPKGDCMEIVEIINNIPRTEKNYVLIGFLTGILEQCIGVNVYHIPIGQFGSRSSDYDIHKSEYSYIIEYSETYDYDGDYVKNYVIGTFRYD